MNSKVASYEAPSGWVGHPEGAAWPTSLERLDSDTETVWVATYWDGTVVQAESLGDIDPHLNYDVLSTYLQGA